METIEFLKNLGIMVLGILFVGGGLYWIINLFNKAKPDFKYYLKYNIFKSKYDEKAIIRLMNYDQAGINVNQVHKFLLVTGNIPKKKAKELCWIYRQIQEKEVKK